MSLKPMLDCGRFRSPCVTCDAEIPRGYPRIAEPCNDGRIPNAKYQYHCIECALTQMPKLVREILLSEQFDEGFVPDATSLKQELNDRSKRSRPVSRRRRGEFASAPTAASSHCYRSSTMTPMIATSSRCSPMR